jgi:hypothetical protein
MEGSHHLVSLEGVPSMCREAGDSGVTLWHADVFKMLCSTLCFCLIMTGAFIVNRLH